MKLSRRRFLLAMAGTCGGCAGAAGGMRWSEEQLQRADAVARGHGGQGWAAWHGGRRIFGWNTGARGPVLSITKALAALAASRASDEGWLTETERVAGTISEWEDDPRKSRITVLMLLQQTAGLEAGVASLYRDPADKGRAAIGLRATEEPGTFFRYGPACWEVLAELLHRKLKSRGETLESYLHRAVMRPMGLDSPRWRSDRKGRFFLSTGAEFGMESLGKLGRTLGRLLAGEATNGFQAGTFARITRPSAVNPMFGGGLWKNVNAGRPGAIAVEVEDLLDPAPPESVWQRACLSPLHPPDMVAAIGSSGRRIFIWPSGENVVARLGRGRSWQDAPLLAALSVSPR